MHDVNEGVIRYTLKSLFDHCIKKRIFSKKRIQALVRDFSYGNLNKKNIPSPLDMDSQTLGQNATQLFCLMIHIPFILYEYREQLETVWTFIESLLEIMQIIYSRRISENDLLKLENLIEKHLLTLIEKTGTHQLFGIN